MRITEDFNALSFTAECTPLKGRLSPDTRFLIRELLDDSSYGRMPMLKQRVALATDIVQIATNLRTSQHRQYLWKILGLIGGQS